MCARRELWQVWLTMAATIEGNQLARAEQDKMCRSKRRFRRENDAINAAVRARVRGSAPARVYRCPVCTGYHLGSR